MLGACHQDRREARFHVVAESVGPSEFKRSGGEAVEFVL